MTVHTVRITRGTIVYWICVVIGGFVTGRLVENAARPTALAVDIGAVYLILSLVKDIPVVDGRAQETT